ncbi:hypothetical protein pdam_00024088 [Pocillopora damicornis]|uniref:Uncharacterized protein n=1 Tax=Pocillopora damicornis TaxID=46731 RepID=A0A3M6UEV3_POCDA|nr:hypothetical protein pdam_00024088 [Pocillopora damicornis]
MEDQELDNGTPIVSAHQLLQHIAEIVNLFNLKCPLTNINDIGLKKLNSFYSFMLDQRKSTDHTSSFISSKLWLDLQSMCLGFHALVQVKLQYFPYSCIRPAIVNQDCVENHFCQFGQTVNSRKSNVGLTSITDPTCCFFKQEKTDKRKTGFSINRVVKAASVVANSQTALHRHSISLGIFSFFVAQNIESRTNPRQMGKFSNHCNRQGFCPGNAGVVLPEFLKTDSKSTTEPWDLMV